MVQEQTKHTFSVYLDYEQTDELVTRAAQMLLHRWSSFFNQMQDNESFLLSRLKQISTYAEQIKGDEYLSNLWLVWVGSRGEGAPPVTALKRMEKVRRLLEQTLYEDGPIKFPAIFVPEIIHDNQPSTKLKHLLRFRIAKQLTVQIYSKLKQNNPGLSTDLSCMGDPYMFSEKLKKILLAYK
jgi:hypothetical protein